MSAENEMRELINNSHRCVQILNILISKKCLKYLQENYSELMLNDDTIERNADKLYDIIQTYDFNNITANQKSEMDYYDDGLIEGNVEYKGEEQVLLLQGITFIADNHNRRDYNIEELASAFLNSKYNISVDKRKDKVYSEIRYRLIAEYSDSKYLEAVCYKYDEKHIRIITAWELNKKGVERYVRQIYGSSS